MSKSIFSHSKISFHSFQVKKSEKVNSNRLKKNLYDIVEFFLQFIPMYSFRIGSNFVLINKRLWMREASTDPNTGRTNRVHKKRRRMIVR